MTVWALALDIHDCHDGRAHGRWYPVRTAVRVMACNRPPSYRLRLDQYKMSSRVPTQPWGDRARRKRDLVRTAETRTPGDLDLT